MRGALAANQQCDVVHDLEVTAQFFVNLGFHHEGPIEVSGVWWIESSVEGVRAELIIVTAPDGSGKLKPSAIPFGTGHEWTLLCGVPLPGAGFLCSRRSRLPA